MVHTVTGGGTFVEYHPNGPGTEQVLRADFTRPFRRVDMWTELQRLMPTVCLPPPNQLDTPGVCADVAARTRAHV
jgi:hypothetical protein